MAISFCAGAWLSWAPVNVNLFCFVIAVVLLVIAGVAFLRDYRINVIAAGVMLCVGFSYYGYVESPMNRDAGGLVDELVTIEGRIANTPYVKGDLYHYELDTRQINSASQSLSVTERVRVTSTNEYKYGDVVAFEGFFKDYERDRSSKRFDSRLYNESRGTYFHLYSIEDSHSDISVRKNLSYYIGYIKNKINVCALARYPGDEGAVICAILTGNKSFLSDELSSLMTKTGTKRYLYSAHVHLMLLSMCLLFVMRRLSKRLKNIIFILVFGLFALLSSDSPTFLKVFIMAGLGIAWVMLFKLSPKCDIISACVIVAGLINPLVLTDAGFIVSIASSIVIAASYAPIKARIERRFKRRVPHIVLMWVLISLVITPLSIRLFGSVSPFSFLLTGLYTVLIGASFVLVPVGLIFGFKISILPWIFLQLPRLVSRLPLSYLTLPRPSILFLAAFYCLFFAFVYYNRRKTFMRLCFVAAVALCSMLCLSVYSFNRVELHFVDVGQADAEVVRLPYRATVLIDGGGSESYSDYNVGEYEYLPYLIGSGITHADALIVSHFHKDHAEGVIAALKNIRVDKLYLPYVCLDDEYHKEILKLAKESDIDIVYVKKPLAVNLHGLELNLYPPLKSYDDENDTSLVVKVSYGDVSALYTGDITKVREADIIGEGVDLTCDVLKAPHHGSRESSSVEFLNATKPKLVVYEVGRNNTFGFPTDEACNNALSVGAGLLSTASQGDIVISISKSKIESIKYWGEDFGKGK